jgi:hypothetical protein
MATDTSPGEWVDPSLDACCAKDAQQSAAAAERNRVLRVEAAKRGLDFAPHRRFAPAQTLGLAGGGEIAIIAAGSDSTIDRSGQHDDSDDDLAFLDELDADDDQAELAKLRENRLAQLRADAAKPPPLHASIAPQFGAVALVKEDQLLRLVGSSDRVVCLLGLASVGNNEAFAAMGSAAADAVLSGVQAHMHKLAQTWKGTQFVCTAVANTSSAVLTSIRANGVLPALICFREGVVADKATHPHQLQQFINMGDIGFAIFEAWLTQSDLLVSAPRAESQIRRASVVRMAGEEHQATDESQQDENLQDRPSSLVADTVERASAQAELRAALGDERAPLPGKARVPLAPGAWAQSACDDPNCRVGFSHEHLMG